VTVSAIRPAFVDPCFPVDAVRPPQGPDWLHEPSWDGYRIVVVKDGVDVRLYAKNAREYGKRLPRLMDWFANLPARTAVIDGELCFIDAAGQADFSRLGAEMRCRWPNEAHLMMIAFDLLHRDGLDLRHLALSERKAQLDKLCRGAQVVPFIRQVQAFPDGAALLDHLSRYRFEGIVSKRRDKPYVSGPSRFWVKVRRENKERLRLFKEARYATPRAQALKMRGEGPTEPGHGA
jgi:bifunctional non-homologous end joining protein LigD